MNRLLAALALAPLLYLGAGAVGGAIPRNAAWVEPDDGVTIFVATNGIHSGVVLPAITADMDWRTIVRPSHLADPRAAGQWLWFGWGDRDFYLNTPTWAELSAATVLRAAIGSDATLIHVDHLAAPYDDARPVRLSRDQYRRLVAGLRASFDLRPDGTAVPIRGYGAWDVFYPARGRYSAFTTCNAWTGRLLGDAGVRVGAWTPFSATVMQWF
jgi:uncharacterized protein (TIGR02117 family)